MLVPPVVGLGAGDRLDDGVIEVALVAVVHVVAEPLDVTELVECDGLDIEAAVGRIGVRLAPLEAAPVEAMALLPEPHREAVRRPPGEAGDAVGAARVAGAIADRIRSAVDVGEGRGARSTRAGRGGRGGLDGRRARWPAASEPVRQSKVSAWSWSNQPLPRTGSGPWAPAGAGVTRTTSAAAEAGQRGQEARPGALTDGSSGHLRVRGGGHGGRRGHGRSGRRPGRLGDDGVRAEVERIAAVGIGAADVTAARARRATRGRCGPTIRGRSARPGRPRR